MLKKTIFLLVLVAVVSLSAFSIDPDEMNSVTIENQTGLDILYLFFAPSDGGNWGFDVLGSEYYFGAESSLGYYIHYPEECFDFHIMAVDDNEKRYVIRDFTICDDEPANITFYPDDATSDFGEYEYITLNLTNDTGYDFSFVFLSPSDSAAWGIDMLSEDSYLEDQQTLSWIVPGTRKTYSYDVLCQDNEGDTYQTSLDVSTQDADEYGEIDLTITMEDLNVDYDYDEYEDYEDEDYEYDDYEYDDYDYDYDSEGY